MQKCTHPYQNPNAHFCDQCGQPLGMANTDLKEGFDVFHEYHGSPTLFSCSHWLKPSAEEQLAHWNMNNSRGSELYGRYFLGKVRPAGRLTFSVLEWRPLTWNKALKKWEMGEPVAEPPATIKITTLE